MKCVIVFGTVVNVLDVVACRMLVDAFPGDQRAGGYCTVMCMSVCMLEQAVILKAC